MKYLIHYSSVAGRGLRGWLLSQSLVETHLDVQSTAGYRLLTSQKSVLRRLASEPVSDSDSLDSTPAVTSFQPGLGRGCFIRHLLHTTLTSSSLCFSYKPNNQFKHAVLQHAFLHPPMKHMHLHNYMHTYMSSEQIQKTYILHAYMHTALFPLGLSHWKHF